MSAAEKSVRVAARKQRLWTTWGFVLVPLWLAQVYYAATMIRDTDDVIIDADAMADEAGVLVHELAASRISCVKNGRLPLTRVSDPPTTEDIQRQPHGTVAKNRKPEGCTEFVPPDRLPFELRWAVRRDHGHEGYATAEIDLDGDRKLETLVRVKVTCEDGRCEAGLLEKSVSLGMVTRKVPKVLFEPAPVSLEYAE